MTPTAAAAGALCPDDDLLASFASGAVNAGDRQKVEAHVDLCAACQDLLAELAETFSPASSGKGARSLGTVGRYELLRIVGEGGMGIVYEARDPVLGRRVALKLIAGPEADAERLLREGRAMARVDHINVVTVFDAGVHDGRVFIAMQLVRGDSLRRHLATPRTATELLAIFREAAKGLAAAHAANVVHRDFKPENVLVGADAVRVTDFGLARPALGAGAPRSAANGPLSTDVSWVNEAETQGMSGTPAYLSPEQIDGGVVGPKSDQFSLGVALHEALYGRHPFGLGAPRGPATLRELRARMDHGPAEPTAAADVPAWISPIADRLLAVDPEQRFASMSEVATRLAGPDQHFDRHASRLLAAIMGTMVLHVSLLAILVGCIFVPEAADAPDGWSYPLDLYAGYVFLVWGALGAFAAPVAAFGLVRRRRWAYLYCFVYAVASLPTVLGTPLAIIAFHVLSRAEVKAAFGRVSRQTPRAAALAQG